MRQKWLLLALWVATEASHFRNPHVQRLLEQVDDRLVTQLRRSERQSCRYWSALAKGEFPATSVDESFLLLSSQDAFDERIYRFADAFSEHLVNQQKSPMNWILEQATTSADWCALTNEQIVQNAVDLLMADAKSWMNLEEFRRQAVSDDEENFPPTIRSTSMQSSTAVAALAFDVHEQVTFEVHRALLHKLCGNSTSEDLKILSMDDTGLMNMRVTRLADASRQLLTVEEAWMAEWNDFTRGLKEPSLSASMTTGPKERDDSEIETRLLMGRRGIVRAAPELFHGFDQVHPIRKYSVKNFLRPIQRTAVASARKLVADVSTRVTGVAPVSSCLTPTVPVSIIVEATGPASPSIVEATGPASPSIVYSNSASQTLSFNTSEMYKSPPIWSTLSSVSADSLSSLNRVCSEYRQGIKLVNVIDKAACILVQLVELAFYKLSVLVFQFFEFSAEYWVSWKEALGLWFGRIILVAGVNLFLLIWFVTAQRRGPSSRMMLNELLSLTTSRLKDENDLLTQSKRVYRMLHDLSSNVKNQDAGISSSAEVLTSEKKSRSNVLADDSFNEVLQALRLDVVESIARFQDEFVEGINQMAANMEKTHANINHDLNEVTEFFASEFEKLGSQSPKGVKQQSSDRVSTAQDGPLVTAETDGYVKQSLFSSTSSDHPSMGDFNRPEIDMRSLSSGRPTGHLMQPPSCAPQEYRNHQRMPDDLFSQPRLVVDDRRRLQGDLGGFVDDLLSPNDNV